MYGSPCTSTTNAPRARASSTAARSAGEGPCLGGATRPSKIRGELTMAASPGRSSGTRMTSIRKRAVFGSSSGDPVAQPGSSSADRTGAEPET